MDQKTIIKWLLIAAAAYVVYKYVLQGGVLDKLFGTTAAAEEKKKIDDAAAAAKTAADAAAAAGRLTADQAAAEKARIDKAAADAKAALELKAATDKATADKAAADKAATNADVQDRRLAIGHAAAEQAASFRVTAAAFEAMGQHAQAQAFIEQAEALEATARAAGVTVTATPRVTTPAGQVIVQPLAQPSIVARAVPEISEEMLISAAGGDSYAAIDIVRSSGLRKSADVWNYYRGAGGKDVPNVDLLPPSNRDYQMTIDEYFQARVDNSLSGLGGLGAGFRDLSRMVAVNPWIV